MAANAFQPMDIGEIFSSTFSLIRRIFAKALLPAFIVLFLLSLLLGYAVELYFGMAAEFFARSADLQGNDPEVAREVGQQVIGFMLPVIGIAVVYFFGIIFVDVLIVVASWESINDRPLHFGSLLRRSFGRPYWVMVLQMIIYVAILLAISMVLAMSVAIATGFDQTKIAQISPYLNITFLVMIIYPLVATVFSIQKVVIEDRGPWHGLIASINLVKDYWLRTFGILLLIFLAFAAIKLLVGTLTGGGIQEMAGLGSIDSQDHEAMAAAFSEMRDRITWTSIAVDGCVSTLQILFFFTLLTPMYVDLRARRGEFLIEEGDGADAGYLDEPEA